MEYAFFFGRHPELSWAELTRVLNRSGVKFAIIARGSRLAILKLNRELTEDFIDQLGGTLRIGRVLARQLVPWTAGAILAVFTPRARTFKLGLSAPAESSRNAAALGRELKRSLKRQGYAMKFILPLKAGRLLNAAQVLFNRLTQPPQAELVLFQLLDEYWLTRTTHIQDIRAYARRDRQRPHRDAAAGMLPPKVAQMMLNLVPAVVGQSPSVLDPFCGTGTIVMEGALLGWRMFGSDKQADMVRATRANVQWLQGQWPGRPWAQTTCFVHDASQPFPRHVRGKISAVVTEPYLGRPLRAPLPRRLLLQQQADLMTLYQAFFAHAQALLAQGGSIVFALPAVRQKDTSGWQLLPQSFLDGVASLGLRLERLAATARGTVVYSRPDALVGREITLWHIKRQAVQHVSGGIRLASGWA